MEKWEHSAKTWCLIGSDLAIEDIKDGSIVKCIFPDGKEYIFNLPDKENPTITLDEILKVEWYVYTWAL